MEFELNYIGGSIVELIITFDGVKMTHQITDFNGKVDPEIIQRFYDMSQDLKNYNLAKKQ